MKMSLNIMVEHLECYNVKLNIHKKGREVCLKTDGLS